MLKTCNDCGGRGQLPAGSTPCTNCEGDGYKNLSKCAACNGTGYIAGGGMGMAVQHGYDPQPGFCGSGGIGPNYW